MKHYITILACSLCILSSQIINAMHNQPRPRPRPEIMDAEPRAEVRPAALPEHQQRFINFHLPMRPGAAVFVVVHRNMDFADLFQSIQAAAQTDSPVLVNIQRVDWAPQPRVSLANIQANDRLQEQWRIGLANPAGYLFSYEIVQP